jgi:hypothetical protein
MDERAAMVESSPIKGYRASQATYQGMSLVPSSEEWTAQKYHISGNKLLHIRIRKGRLQMILRH